MGKNESAESFQRLYIAAVTKQLKKWNHGGEGINSGRVER
jgi:hypothetical protein